jgi:hypothetical protein
LNKLPKDTYKAKEIRIINGRERKSSRGGTEQGYTLKKDQIEAVAKVLQSNVNGSGSN